jgi:hypothetical protein
MMIPQRMSKKFSSSEQNPLTNPHRFARILTNWSKNDGTFNI